LWKGDILNEGSIYRQPQKLSPTKLVSLRISLSP
jgi:hypothetical protein